MEHRHIIDKLGGGLRLKVALDEIGHHVTAEQVYRWRCDDRIPSRHLPWIADLAVGVIDNFDERAFVRGIK